MGKMADELNQELEPTRRLLRIVGDALGVTIEEAITSANITRYDRLFEAAIRQRRAPTVAPAAPPARPRAVGGGLQWDTFDDHVDDQIDRMVAQGLTVPREGNALAVSDPAGAQNTASEWAEIAMSIAKTIGSSTQGSLTDVLAGILGSVRGVMIPGGDIEIPKGDSLADAVAHGHQQNHELRERHRNASMIVQRVAAVLQVAKVDDDGTEILERVQRWEHLKHAFKRRIRELRRPAVRVSPEDEQRLTAVADELEHHLAELLSRQELADWIKSKPTGIVSKAISELAATPPTAPYPFAFDKLDTNRIAVALDGERQEKPSDADRIDKIIEVFDEIHESRTADDEFVRLMNIVILPMLARQRAAQQPPRPLEE